MKRWFCSVAMVLCLCVASSSAVAQVPQAGDLGAGLSLGAPTSVTAKYYLSDGQAVDAHIGGIPFFSRGFHGSLFVGASYLLEFFEIADIDLFRMSAYGGGGLAFVSNVGRVRTFDTFYEGNVVFYEHGLGARFPLGVAAHFRDLPLEVYFELSPTAAFLFRDAALEGPTIVFFPYLWNAALGGRYYFE